MISSVDFLARIATANLEDKGGGAAKRLKIHEGINKEMTLQFGSEGLGLGSV